ncbi:RHS repeat-associated core domain-containing protein, partial [Buttiauxella sp.]|uniref:RHS repeat-associated core domain-containing protein n=1 Tax=Buttiauxella sp. TaxID=1972222 RepID=UPI003C78F4D5
AENLALWLEPEAENDRKIHLYHCDHLGTPLALVDREGNIDWHITLDPWGNVLSENNPQQLHQPLRMQGQQIDEESGLHYNRHRYYDPAQGRYISQDPIGLAGGWNGYSYTFNPIQQSDPLGLSDNWGDLFSLGTIGGVDYGEAATSAGARLSSDESARALSNMASTEGAWTPGSDYVKAWSIDTPIISLTALFGPAASFANMIRSSTLFCSANISYQWIEHGEVKASDAATAALTGALYPGRLLSTNTLIASGIAYLNSGSNSSAVGAGVGTVVSGLLGKIPLLSNIVGDYVTGITSEGTSDNVGSIINKDNGND